MLPPSPQLNAVEAGTEVDIAPIILSTQIFSAYLVLSEWWPL